VPLWALRGSVRCIAPVALPPSTPPRISSRRWSRENDIKKQQLGYLSFIRLFVVLFCLFPFFSSSLVILVLFILFVFFPFFLFCSCSCFFRIIVVLSTYIPSKFRVYMVENNDLTGKMDQRCVFVPYFQTNPCDLTE